MTKKRYRVFQLILFVFSLNIIASTTACAVSTKQNTAQFEKQNGIPIYYKNVPNNEKVAFKSLASETAEQEALTIMKNVLALYPSDLNDFLQISSINLVGELTSTANSVALDGKTQRVTNATYPSGYATQLFLNYPTTNETYFIYHHELFHAIEFIFPPNEQKWAKIAPANQYGNNYQKGSDGYYHIERKNGFISTYSYQSEYEDRADIYAYLLAPSDTSPIQRALIANDSIIKQKAGFIIGYTDTIFAKHEDSKRLLTALEESYDYFFSQKYFAAKEIHRVTKKETVFADYTKDGTSVTLKPNDLLYILEKTNNPKDTYLALDKEGHLLYIPDSITELIQKPAIKPLINDLKKQSISIGYKSKHQQIAGSSIANEKSVISSEKAHLLYVTLNNIQTWLNKQTKPRISHVVFLENMTYNRKSIAVKCLDRTLYIDIRSASNQDILNALLK